MRTSYLKLKNAHFLFGGFSTMGLEIMEGSLKAWDKDTGFPSELIRHNMHSSEPYLKRGCMAGIISEEGKGSKFYAEELKANTTPLFQMRPVSPPGYPLRNIESAMRLSLKGAPDITKGYSVYIHGIEMKDGTRFSYYGITSRHWLQRLKEHESDARTGSPLLFHRHLRDNIQTATRFVSTIVAAGRTKDEAYNIEEYLVAKHSLYPNNPYGLNMIPGGYEGLRHLSRMGAAVDRTTEPEARDAIVMDRAYINSRLGIANPSIALRWTDDDYAEAVICGRENRLTAEQVRHIRMLAATGWTKSHIAMIVKAIDVDQVNRVLTGKTYGRIK